jgi:hypothetical protein
MLAAALLLTFAEVASSAALYAPWAHSHVVWAVAGTPAVDIISLADAYAARNISVGAVNVDSGWATGFDSFQPDPAFFGPAGGFSAFVDALQKTRSLRVIAWMTSFINVDSPNFAAALAHNYFVRDATGKQVTTLSWWHGVGGLLDYSNPAARSWWEAAMVNGTLGGGNSGGAVIDGWKCDGSDPYVIELLFPQGATGPFTYQDYSNFYYGHSLNFTRTINPEALIWGRPVDGFPLALNLTAFLAYAPKYAMVSGWVGDADPDFDGLQATAINLLESAWQGYANFGSDTGGYRGSSPAHTRTPELFLRWAQLNAFLPLFENGGNDDHTPWAFDAAGGTGTAITDAYRRLVHAHVALTPYLLSIGTASLNMGISALAPTSAPPKDFPFIIEPSDVSVWSFALGPNIFSSPVLFEGVDVINVTLPSSAASAALATRWGGAPASGDGWIDFWDPSRAFPDGALVAYAAPRTGSGDELVSAVFLRAGALVPVHVSTHLPLIAAGSERWAPALTLFLADLGRGLAADGSRRCANASTSVTLEDTGVGADGMRASASVSVHRGAPSCRQAVLRIVLSPYYRPVVIVVRRSRARGRAVSLNGRVLARVSADARDRRAGVPAALAWDATARGGGRYPLASGIAERLATRFEEELAGTFSAEDGESVVYIGEGDAADGGVVIVEYE